MEEESQRFANAIVFFCKGETCGYVAGCAKNQLNKREEVFASGLIVSTTNGAAHCLNVCLIATF